MKNFDDISSLAKFSNMIRKDEHKSVMKTVLIVVGLAAIACVAAYCIYRFFSPDYMDDFDDEFDDDFDDNFFDEDSEELESAVFVDDEKE